MKKIKLALTAVCFAVCSAAASFAQAIVHDPINSIPILSNWLTAIDTLYANYDMVRNTMKTSTSRYNARLRTQKISTGTT